MSILKEKEHRKESVLRSFITYFDGVYNIEPQTTFTTFTMGVTKLFYDVHKNELHVWLRRPGLLIGKGGKTMEAVKKYLELDEIFIKEDLLV